MAQDTKQPLSRSQLQKHFGYANALMTPRIEKIVVNTGVGRYDDQARKSIAQDLDELVGQHASPTKARESIASFKTRKGVVLGYRATLRGKRMRDFLYRMIHVAIPRMRDFRGIPLSAGDGSGDLHIGFREHAVFPEMIGKETRLLFGLQASVVIHCRGRKEAMAFYRS